jgi:hypothetical protein
MVLKATSPDLFNNADNMRIVGDDQCCSILPPDQEQLQLGFWVLIITSPVLLIGCDVRKISPESCKIVLNGFVLFINQDLGIR